jgi:hypothetical protein
MLLGTSHYIASRQTPRKHRLLLSRIVLGFFTDPLSGIRRPIVACVGSRTNVFIESLPSNGYTRHSIIKTIFLFRLPVHTVLRNPVLLKLCSVFHKHSLLKKIFKKYTYQYTLIIMNYNFHRNVYRCQMPLPHLMFCFHKATTVGSTTLLSGLHIYSCIYIYIYLFTYMHSIIPCGGGIQYLHRIHASRRRRRKGNPLPGGHNWATCHWGTYTESWSSRLGVGRKADDLALWKKKTTTYFCELESTENWMTSGRIF